MQLILVNIQYFILNTRPERFTLVDPWMVLFLFIQNDICFSKCTKFYYLLCSVIMNTTRYTSLKFHSKTRSICKTFSHFLTTLYKLIANGLRMLLKIITFNFYLKCREFIIIITPTIISLYCTENTCQRN